MKLKQLLFLLVCIFYSTLIFSQEYKYKEYEGVRTFHEGSLFVKEGVPFLTVKGESYEMGLQYGVLLNDQILYLILLLQLLNRK